MPKVWNRAKYDNQTSMNTPPMSRCCDSCANLADVCIKPSCPNCHTLPQEKKCDGCSMFGKLGVHSMRCPIRGEKIEVVRQDIQPELEATCPNCLSDYGSGTSGAKEGTQSFCPSLPCREIHPRPVMSIWKRKDIQPEWKSEFVDGAFRGLPEKNKRFLIPFIEKLLLSRDTKLKEAVESLRMDESAGEDRPFYGTGAAQLLARTHNATLDAILNLLSNPPQHD